MGKQDRQGEQDIQICLLEWSCLQIVFVSRRSFLDCTYIDQCTYWLICGLRVTYLVTVHMSGHG